MCSNVKSCEKGHYESGVSYHAGIVHKDTNQLQIFWELIGITVFSNKLTPPARSKRGVTRTPIFVNLIQNVLGDSPPDPHNFLTINIHIIVMPMFFSGCPWGSLHWILWEILKNSYVDFLCWKTWKNFKKILCAGFVLWYGDFENFQSSLSVGFVM